MLDRLGWTGIGALAMTVACVAAAATQGSTVAGIAAVPAGLYVLMRLFRTADA